ncbi:hypothetical protein COLO4_24476 [Corchorus olitorius]|uniref:Uncharacterized protein n=1 Tax=Corchorus olitorius TaxID=93759 RepID=A0A1R3I9R3_9ROSI|nr:hypothetical protein COLO4_24476 [Corchorus olitorius]
MVAAARNATAVASLTSRSGWKIDFPGFRKDYSENLFMMLSWVPEQAQVGVFHDLS